MQWNPNGIINNQTQSSRWIESNNSDEKSAYLSKEQHEKIKHILEKLSSNHQSGIVGVFDSGAGGLTVVNALQKNPPSSILYLGDTAHFPYGEKTTPELIELVINDLEWLVERNAEVIAIACNTASVIWRLIKPADFSGPILDTFSVVSDALKEAHPSKIGVIATHYTVKAHAFETIIHAAYPDIDVQVIASAEQPLIGAIERNDQAAIRTELARITDKFSHHSVDMFILGCTHYAHIIDQLGQALPGVTMINPSILLANAVTSELPTAVGSSSVDNDCITTITFTGPTPDIYSPVDVHSTPSAYSVVDLS